MPSEVEELLTTKGPGKIPAWGYGVGLAALFLGWEWYRNKSGASTPATSGGTGTAGTTAPGTTTVTTTDSGWAPPWVPFTTLGPRQPPSPETNTEWRHISADWLAAKGFPDGQVEDVLSDYLHGQRLSREEQRIVDLAIDEWGRPPEGRAPVSLGQSEPDQPADVAPGADFSGGSGSGGSSSSTRVVRDRRTVVRDRDRRRGRGGDRD